MELSNSAIKLENGFLDCKICRLRQNAGGWQCPRCAGLSQTTTRRFCLEPRTVTLSRELEPIMDSFMQNRRQDIRELRQAVTAGELAQAACIAHGIKGVLGSFGFMEGYRLAIELQGAARELLSEKATISINSLEDYISTIQISYI